MVNGEGPSSSSKREAGEHAEDVSRKKRHRGDRFAAIEQLVDAPRANSAHLSSDVQPDFDLTRVLADRRKKYLEAKYKHWEDGLVRIALGVVLRRTPDGGDV